MNFYQSLEQINAWRCPTLTWGGPTLPSAQNGFTSEFEMGSGGSHSLWSPSKLVAPHQRGIHRNYREQFSMMRFKTVFQFNIADSGNAFNQVYVLVKCYFTTLNVLECYMVKPHGQLVLG